MMDINQLSWADRFVLIDKLNPSDAQICASFMVTMDELASARQMRYTHFTEPASVDVSKHLNVFNVSTTPTKTIQQPIIRPTQKVQVVSRPVIQRTVTKPTNTTPKQSTAKRGRKSDKIVTAFMAVTSERVPADAFALQHDISVAVLRQAKRFIEKMDESTQKQLGKIVVKQDKNTKQLMIWRE